MRSPRLNRCSGSPDSPKGLFWFAVWTIWGKERMLIVVMNSYPNSPGPGMLMGVDEGSGE